MYSLKANLNLMGSSIVSECLRKRKHSWKCWFVTIMPKQWKFFDLQNLSVSYTLNYFKIHLNLIPFINKFQADETLFSESILGEMHCSTCCNSTDLQLLQLRKHFWICFCFIHCKGEGFTVQSNFYNVTYKWK